MDFIERQSPLLKEVTPSSSESESNSTHSQQGIIHDLLNNQAYDKRLEARV
jgi:hypothetical protein